jgi:hypothetical protein
MNKDTIHNEIQVHEGTISCPSASEFFNALKKISENDEIDISIHCDAGIFEWLLCYILAYDDN